MRISQLSKLFGVALLTHNSVSALNIPSAESEPQSIALKQKTEISATMNNFLAKLSNNQPWNSYAQYLDYPDAGNPDCGMFIESYTITNISTQGKTAQVKVNYQIKGEFAGTNYYKYPQMQTREINYALVNTTRKWKITEESGITNYIPLQDKKLSWKIKDGDIRLLNVKYLPWHFNYYNSDKNNHMLNSIPSQHCWQ